MALKYKTEIDKFELTIDCPQSAVAIPNELPSFRFSFSPIGHEHNFLPNVVFDRVRNSSVNYAKKSPEQKCSRCGASFYQKKDDCKYAWSNLPGSIREILSYTHIAFGKLNTDDGVMVNGINGHFTFYENEGADLKSKFELIEELEMEEQ